MVATWRVETSVLTIGDQSPARCETDAFVTRDSQGDEYPFRWSDWQGTRPELRERLREPERLGRPVDDVARWRAQPTPPGEPLAGTSSTRTWRSSGHCR